MILHLIVESQFTDYVINQFSAPEMHSEVVIIHSENYIKHVFQEDKVRVIRPRSSEFNDLLNALSEYSAVVLHGLFQPWCEAVLRNVPDHVKIAWAFWGGEIYGRQDLQETFMSKRSKMLLRLHEIKHGKNKKKDIHYELPKELFQRIDYCLTDIKEEYEFAKRYLQTQKMEYVWYNYYSIEETLGNLADKQCFGEDIFLGNSCSLECNYFDVIPKLKSLLSLKGKKVITPMSYGLPWLRNIVIRYGNRYLGKSFYPLTKFLPIEDYNQLMLSCSIMIQPQYRPQAQGNIITGLWLGMKVYLSERSMAYQWFKRIGVEVFSVETDLNRKNKGAFEKLSQASIDHNRKVLLSIYSKDAYKQRIDQLVDLLN